MTKRRISPTDSATAQERLHVTRTRQEQEQRQPSDPSSELQTFTLLNIEAETESELIRFVEEDNDIAGPSRLLRHLHNTEVRQVWREKTNGESRDNSKVEKWLANLPESFESMVERQMPQDGETPRRGGHWLSGTDDRFPSAVGLIVARERRTNDEGQAEGSRDR